MKKNFVLFGIIIILSTVILSSIAICVIKPKMHKPFSLNVIEYMIKFKSNGDMETVKTITTTTINNEEK